MFDAMGPAGLFDGLGVVSPLGRSRCGHAFGGSGLAALCGRGIALGPALAAESITAPATATAAIALLAFSTRCALCAFCTGRTFCTGCGVRGGSHSLLCAGGSGHSRRSRADRVRAVLGSLLCSRVLRTTGIIPIPTAASTAPTPATALAVSLCRLARSLADDAVRLRAGAFGCQGVALGAVCSFWTFRSVLTLGALWTIATFTSAWAVFPRLGSGSYLGCVQAFFTSRAALLAPASTLTTFTTLTALTTLTTLTTVMTHTTLAARTTLTTL
ncbi:MAG: hypothetical protein ACKOD9_10160, partial [Rubrivivax sp.]